MTATATPPEREVGPVPAAPAAPTGRAALPAIADTVLRWAAALAAAVAVFGAVLLVTGADPVSVFTNAWSNTVLNGDAVQQILIKAGPFALTALAVVVPSRAGLVNVGGEGQLIAGGIAAAGVSLALGSTSPGGLTMILMIVAGIAAGAAWAGVAALLRLTVKVNEAVSTLLLNYVALDLMLFLIYQPWKDPHGTGQPATPPVPDAAKLPVFTGSAVHVGLLLVALAVVAVWAVFRWTAWGYRLAAVGGNPEAARRAGLPVTRLLLTAMIVGGALAGLGGAIHLAGVEYQLRPSFGSQLGYIGFLASWLARHRPGPVLLSAVVLAGLAVAGDSLQIDSALPAATVNILTGLILIAVLGWTGSRKKARA
ncbi:MAG TPA: ABC transporter permease [Kineosporiaceae bacterium]